MPFATFTKSDANLPRISIIRLISMFVCAYMNTKMKSVIGKRQHEKIVFSVTGLK